MLDTLREKVRNCPNLPTMPSIAVQVLELAQKAEVDLNEIARTITQDPALAGKILKTVNSSFYGCAHAVSTVSHALVILGLQSVKTLVLGFSLVTNLTQDRRRGFNHLQYWRHCVYAATSARVLCSRTGFLQAEEAFLSALLADIGVLVLDRLMPEQYTPIYARAESHADLARLELPELGATHADVGGWLAEMWKLPPLLTTPIACHHSPGSVTDPSLQKLSTMVGIASRCADVFCDEIPARAIADVRAALKASSNMPDREVDQLLSEIAGKTREVASLFEINIGSSADFASILKRANEALVDLTLQTQQQAAQLSQQNQQLKVQATTDRLTGLSNRATFDEFLAEHFARASRTGSPLSLLLLDLDKFKSVNDRFGHPVGDAVLRYTAELLRSCVREGDMAARYGGEEMALVLPDTDRSTATAVAETIRRAIAAKPVVCGKVSIPITASIGVATLEAGIPFKLPAHLLKAADLAMYRAKQSGRNNVKVFIVQPHSRAA